MAGISHVLNVAKEALLAHQLSVQVASHNVANVDTPGFTRQTLSLTTNLATPGAVGSIGGGVKGEQIKRNFDQFITQRIVTQEGVLGNLDAQQESLRIVEAIFNEAPGLALNDLLSKFWNSWQDLSDNPEVLATRQTVVQNGQLLFDHLQTMNAEIIRARSDIAINLDTAVEDVNSLSRQIANLNVEISTSEGPGRDANDLRDKRDELVKELSKFLDVSYFETKTGAYTVLLADGHPLVETESSWQVEWANNQLYWLNTTPEGETTRQSVGSGAELGGKIGGWLEIRGQLTDGDPDNYLGRLDAFTNALVREVNQQHSQGVGMVSFSDDLLSTYTATNAALLTTTVNTTSANTTIQAGTFTVNDRAIGEIDGAVAVNGLAMEKAYNAVTAINDAVTGVRAKLTNLVAGSAVTPMAASPANNGDVISFDINGIAVSYTVDNDGIGTDDSDPAVFSANVVAAINAAIAAYNADPTNAIDMSLQAQVGDGTNGGVLNAIVLRNTNAGDESRIRIENITSVPAGLEASLGLTEGTYTPDATHNTGEISLFSDTPFTVKAGTDDVFLDQLGMGGGSLSSDDVANDGQFTYRYADGGVDASLQGFKFADELITDNGSFDIWIYNSDGTLALPQPVTVDIERAYTLQDVANAINVSITNASGLSTPWINATLEQNKLKLSPDSSHTFAFANDTSNFLQVAGVNTFFSGHDASTIGLNSAIVDDLSLIAAGTVTSYGEIFRGDNSNALAITSIQHAENIAFTGGQSSTFDGFYNALVGTVGNLGRSVSRDLDFNTLVLNQMNEMRDSTSGVSLDEEMANLIKFQHAYTAAAKLISMSDEMLVTLLGTVQR